MMQDKNKSSAGAENLNGKLLRRKRIIAIASIAVLLGLFAVVGYFVGRPLVKMAENPGAFRDWVDSKNMWGRLLMMGIMALQVIVALIPGEPFELGAGYAFGAFEGTILCLVGAAAASALIFSLVKRYGRRFVELFVDTGKIDSWAFMKNEQNLDILVLILFLIPGTPKDILVYLTGLTKMSLGRFLIITTLARIPSVLSSTIAGSLVNSQKYSVAGIVYGVTLLVSLICVFFYRRHVKKREAAAQTAAGKKDGEADT